METNHDVTPAVDRCAARGVFSRIGFATLLFLAANAGTGAAMAFLLPDLSADARTLLSYVLLYTLGTGLFFLTVRGLPREREEKRVIPFSSFLAYLCVGYFFLIVGNLIGTLITLALGASSAVDALLLNTNALVSALPLILFAPVCEELMFRKLVIDRTAVYGPWEAVVFSAVLFASVHGNLSQAFYAFGLGLVLGVLYLRTRNLWYTIAIHAFVNLMQGALPAALMQFFPDGGAAYTLLLSQITTLAFGLAIAGLVICIRRKKALLPPQSGIPRVGALMYVNPGVFLYLIASACMFVAFTLVLIG